VKKASRSSLKKRTKKLLLYRTLLVGSL